MFEFFFENLRKRNQLYISSTFRAKYFNDNPLIQGHCIL